MCRHVNFLGGSPLNRLSWLRPSTSFLNAVLASKDTRWIVFQSGKPLVKLTPGSKESVLARLPTTDVRALLGPSPVFGQGKEPGATHEASAHSLEAARLHGPPIVFLGAHEPEGLDITSALPSTEFSASEDPDLLVAKLHGIPYFALDAGNSSEDELKSLVTDSSEAKIGEGYLEFVEPRSASSNFSFFEAGVFAEARSMLDWNARNRVEFQRMDFITNIMRSIRI